MMRILWAEDEEHITGTAAILSESWQIEVVIACDDAINALQLGHYDLIIVDLILPITLRERQGVPFELQYVDPLEKSYAGCWLIRYIRETLKVDTPIMVYTIVVGHDRDLIENSLLAGKIGSYHSKYDTPPDELDSWIKELAAGQGA
jgi:CheY-like chemotaxis protein